jgi:SAM-dependent methyltransferase
MASPLASSATAPGRPCPLCGSGVADVLPAASDEKGHCFPRRRCTRCGTGFLDPLPTAAQLNAAYAVSYYGEGATKFPAPIERLREAAAAGRARHLLRGLPTRARILDVGCGDGRLLRLLGQRAPAAELHGIELPGPAADRAAAVPGLRLHRGTLENAPYPDRHFDLISLVHVLEHLPEPGAALDRLTRLLRPRGRLLLSFPNLASLQARCFGTAWFHLDAPRHLALPPPEAVRQHLIARGLALESLHHACWEQNLYGWLQSALNALDRDRNLLYERLKGNRSHLPERHAAVALHAALAALLLPPALVAELTALLARSGATVEMAFRSPS